MRLNRSLVLLAEVKRDLDRIERFERLDEGLIKGNLSDYLIIEADASPQDVQKNIDNVIKQAASEIDKLDNIAKGLGNLSSITDFSQTLREKLSALSGVVKKTDVSKGRIGSLFGNSFKELTKITGAISTAESTIKSGVESLFNASKAMQGFDDAVKKGDKSFADLVGPKTQFLSKTAESIKKAIGAGEKGFLSKIAGMFGFGKSQLDNVAKIDADKFADQLLGVKLNLIEQYLNSAAAKDAASPDGDSAVAADVVADASPELAAAAAAPSPSGAGESPTAASAPSGESDAGAAQGTDSGAAAGGETAANDPYHNVTSIRRTEWQKQAANNPEEFAKFINGRLKSKLLENKKARLAESRWAKLAGITEEE